MMADTTYPAQNHVTRLFLVQYNLILVGAAALFSLALANPWPLVGAGAFEVLWLGLGASLPGMRRWIDRRDASFRRADAARELSASLKQLDDEYAERVRSLHDALADIRDAGGRAPAPSFERAVARLETLGPLHIELCETHQRIGRFLATTTEADLALEIGRLRASFNAEKDLGLRLTLRQAIALAERRVEYRQSMVHVRRSLDVKLETIERSVAYLRSQGAALPANPSLADEVEALLTETGPAVNVDVEPGAPFGLAPA
jgi:hypothetical protein